MKSSSAVPERILLTGLQGSGKTEAAVQTAAYYRENSIPGKFRVLNTDIPGTVQRCNERFADWESNIEFIDVSDWETLNTASDLYRKISTPDDWLVIDSIDKPWAWVRDLFDYEHAKKTGRLPKEGDWFASVPEADVPGKWDLINGAYQRWIMPLLDWQRCPAHIIACTPSQPVVVEGMFADDKSVQVKFGPYGVRPSGQKALGFQFHTVLLAKYSRKDGYTLTTMDKDRSREQMTDSPVSSVMSFPVAYLIGVAGWCT